MKSREQYRRAIEALIDRENGCNSGISARATYLRIHAERFARTLEFCKLLMPDPGARVLDIGRSPLTGLLAGHYRSVSSLGFPLAGTPDAPCPIPGRDGAHLPHIPFNLTRAQHVEEWPDPGSGFDLIVYCETIEHMHIAPELTLMLLGFLLAPSGRLVVTTPNAVRLGNRLRMLAGINPFERIRFVDHNPGHFREYTREELRNMASVSGLHCISSEVVNLYPGRWKRIFASGLLRGLGDNILTVYTKASA